MASASHQQPTSFKTNVNRAKTKRWVEAKSYTYDGDDWGDADEYDEYGDYDEPPAPSKPTGLRQQGQSAGSATNSPYGSPTASQHKGNENFRPGQPQLQYGLRSATNPQPRIITDLERSNSFDRGDEKRTFSAGGSKYGMPTPGATTYQQSKQDQSRNIPRVQSPTQFDPHQMRQVQPDPRQLQQQRPTHQRDQSGSHPTRVHSPTASYQGTQSYGEPRQPTMRDRAQSTTSNTSSVDVHNRRDFTPSALPPPLHPQGHPTQDSSSISQRPPRSSSLSQTTQPPIPSTVKNTTSITPFEAGLPHRERADSTADKPLPFVRPAEIYKRMQEQKLREQESQGPSLPSMDTVTPRQDDYDSPIQPARREEQPGDSDAGKGTISSHFPGPGQDNTTPAQNMYPSQDKRKDDTINQSSPDNWLANAPQTGSGTNPGTTRAPEAPPTTSQPSLLPVLPEVARMSTFGDSFLSSSTRDHEHPREAIYSLGNSNQPQNEPATTTDGSSTNLQHQPSSGFRSVVNQAFDVTEDQIPPTPSSTAGSGIGRSTSGGTSVISPIISRGPSTSKQNWDSKDVAEEVESSAHGPESSESTNTAEEVNNVPTKPEATGLDDRKEQKRTSFIPGHRRDLSTPSPNNSPARTLALESNLQLRQPQEAELAVATPTDPDFGHRTSPTRGPAGRVGSDLSSGADTRSRNDAYNQSKVRDLAGKFESASSSRRGSDQSPTRRPFQKATTSQKSEMEAPTRPTGDRMESFRPRLPGAWESYVSNAPLTASNKSLDENIKAFRDQPGKAKGVLDESDARTNTNGPESPETPTQAKQIKHEQEASHNDPFSSVAAAGSALANALAAAAGFDNDAGKETTGTNDKARSIPNESVEKTRSRSTSANIALHPEAARPSLPYARHDDDTSSVAPTPPTKDSRPVDDAGTAGYFPLANTASHNQHAEGIEQLTPLSRPPRPPILSTDTGSQYESDRLRREILRDLTPNAPSEPTTAESDSPGLNERRISSNQSLQRHDTGHESMVIPREYDRYWDDASSTSSSQGSRRKGEGSAATKVPEAPSSARTKQELDASLRLDTHNDLPEAVRQPHTTGTRPALESHRFSWERSSLEPQTTADTDQKPLPISPSQPSPYHRQGSPERDDADSNTFLLRQRDQLESPTVGDRFGKEVSDVHDGGINAFQAPTTGHQAPLITENDYAEGSGVLLEKENLESPKLKNDGEHMTVESLPDGAVHEAYGSHAVAKSNALPGASTVDNSIPPPSLNTSAQAKIPAFREILALKTPAERIRGYNEAREQYANQDSGLSHWVAVTSSELPEHADVLANVNRPPAAIMGHKPSSSRLLSGLRSTGTQQQHLNPSPRPGQTMSEGSSPSGSGSKLQVQAKGKDLLHSAGVFGGKANVAAKGLFSKGRSRFKEARGTDKDPTPPSSPVAIPSGMQPQTQPPVEETPDSPSSNPLLEQPGRLHSYPQGHCVPDQEPVPSISTEENDRSSKSLEDGSGLILPSQNEQQHSQSSIAASPKPSASNGDEPFDLDGPSFEDRVTLPDSISRDGTPTQAPDVESNRSGTKTPTQNDSAGCNLSSSSGSLRNSKTQSTPNEQNLPIIFPGPYSRSAAYDLSAKDPVDQPRSEGPPSSQIEEKRFSADSNGTFHTAENDTSSRPDSASLQENLETPKAEKSLVFDSEKAHENARESGTPTTVLPHTARSTGSPTRDGTDDRTTDTQIEHVLPLAKQDYEPSLSRQEYLAREPSLDNIISQVESDRSPSPVSPQHSIHNEPIRRQSTREPIYYGPQHDFGPKTQKFARRSRSPSQTREQPGLQDHPAFRSIQGVKHQGESTTMASERYPANMADQPRPESRPEESGTPRNPVAESKSKSNRNSRNSSFFMNIGSSGKVGVPSVASPADTHSPPLSTTNPNENDRKSKRASLFRSHPGDKGSEGAPSVGSSPALSSAARVESQSSPSAPNSSQHDQSPKNTSSMFRSRLQRASTSGNQSAEGGGKKRRFSALASLFGSRSSRSQPSQAIQARQSQQAPTPSFAPLQQIQHQTPPSVPKPSGEHNNHQSRVGQSLERVGTTSVDHSNYNSPVRSNTSTTQTSNPVWSQAAQRVSQARQSSIKEPSAYAQDAELRQRATSPSNSAHLVSGNTSTAVPPDIPAATPTMKSRNSIFSRNKSRDSSILGGSRDSSAKSWMKGREPGQPDLRNNSFNRQSQLPSTRPPMQHNTSNSTHGSQRVLTFSQFGENQVVPAHPQAQQQVLQGQITDPQSQQAVNPLPQRTSSLANNIPSQGPTRVLTFDQFGGHSIAQHSTRIPPPAPSVQAPASQGQPTNVVTFQQFPSSSNPQTAQADVPPPPPPKDDWHVNVPRQPRSQDKTETREQHKNSLSQTPYNPPTSIPNSLRPSQEPPSAQPEPHSQHRQAPPPIKTEIPSSRLSAFSPSSNSAESRKARQRELESAVPTISTEKETAIAPPKHDASSEENIVMSSSSYPGQEWQPSFAYDD